MRVVLIRSRMSAGRTVVGEIWKKNISSFVRKNWYRFFKKYVPWIPCICDSGTDNFFSGCTVSIMCNWSLHKWCTMPAPKASPRTLTLVRKRSLQTKILNLRFFNTEEFKIYSIQSTAMIKLTSCTGRPTAVNTSNMVTNPALGTLAAPTLANVAVKLKKMHFLLLIKINHPINHRFRITNFFNTQTHLTVTTSPNDNSLPFNWAIKMAATAS